MTSTLNQPGSGSNLYHQWHELLQFRATHPTTIRVIQGTTREYIACGRGTQSVLILPGLLGLGEMTFQHIQGLEDQAAQNRRVIAIMRWLPMGGEYALNGGHRVPNDQ